MWHWFPENASTFTQIDSLFMIILWITGIVFVLVEVALLFFSVKYRHRSGRRARFIHGNSRLEAIWTGATFLIVLFIAAISIRPWMDLRNPSRFPPSGLDILVTAKQFEWNVTYPGADGQLGTADDFTDRNQLHIPVGRPIHVTLAAEDVIHSFFLPEMRVKQDAVPGMTIPIWFEATRAGEYMLGCAELCGLGHYRMRGMVRALAATEFDAWHRENGTSTAAAAATQGPSAPQDAGAVVAVDAAAAADNAHTGH